jgi:hypothetical protein
MCPLKFDSRRGQRQWQAKWQIVVPPVLPVNLLWLHPGHLRSLAHNTPPSGHPSLCFPLRGRPHDSLPQTQTLALECCLQFHSPSHRRLYFGSLTPVASIKLDQTSHNRLESGALRFRPLRPWKVRLFVLHSYNHLTSYQAVFLRCIAITNETWNLDHTESLAPYALPLDRFPYLLYLFSDLTAYCASPRISLF